MFPAEAAVFLEFKLLRGILLVFCSRIITLLALGTCKGDNISHYLKTPSLPDSRIKSAVIQQ
jgi:hypothetical protein